MNNEKESLQLNTDVEKFYEATLRHDFAKKRRLLSRTTKQNYEIGILSQFKRDYKNALQIHARPHEAHRYHISDLFKSLPGKNKKRLSEGERELITELVASVHEDAGYDSNYLNSHIHVLYKEIINLFQDGIQIQEEHEQALSN